MRRLVPPLNELARSSPACREPGRSQSSFPYIRARSPRLPDCSFQVCASACLNSSPYLMIGRRLSRRAALNSTFDVGRWTLNASPAQTVQRLLLQSLNSVKERGSHGALRSQLSTINFLDHSSPRFYPGKSHMKFSNRCFARLSASDGPAKCIDLPVSVDYGSPTQASEHPASQPVRRQ